MSTTSLRRGCAIATPAREVDAFKRLSPSQSLRGSCTGGETALRKPRLELTLPSNGRRRRSSATSTHKAGKSIQRWPRHISQRAMTSKFGAMSPCGLRAADGVAPRYEYLNLDGIYSLPDPPPLLCLYSSATQTCNTGQQVSLCFSESGSSPDTYPKNTDGARFAIDTSTCRRDRPPNLSLNGPYSATRQGNLLRATSLHLMLRVKLPRACPIMTRRPQDGSKCSHTPALTCISSTAHTWFSCRNCIRSTRDIVLVGHCGHRGWCLSRLQAFASTSVQSFANLISNNEASATDSDCSRLRRL